jgi:hypothetical protein
MKFFLRIIDYLIIAFKLFMLVVLILDYRASIGLWKSVALHYLIPFIVYGFISIIRMFKYKNLPLLLFEIISNIFFILTVSSSHAYFLILTIISLFITLHLFYNVRKKAGA